jgi:haloacetate dehalogenase
MFEGFDTHALATERGTIHARVGGSGPPLLLLHGYPETHLMWHSCAAALAERFTVVATDLSGYGDSLRPAPASDHAPHSKRALALDQVQAMAALGHERFAVAGHDRGGRVAYRMALDHPERVLAAYRAQLENPDAVHAICEDYRAGAGIDRQLDEADRGRQIECPVLVLWGARGALEPLYGDVLAVWRPWARDVRGRGVEASHFLVEDRPDEVARELAAFFERTG